MPADKQPSRTAYEVLRAHTAELMKIPGVVGTGEGEVKGSPALVVMVSRRTAEVDRLVPKRLEGYPVEIRVVGDVRAMDRPVEPRSRKKSDRPAIPRGGGHRIPSTEIPITSRDSLPAPRCSRRSCSPDPRGLRLPCWRPHGRSC